MSEFNMTIHVFIKTEVLNLYEYSVLRPSQVELFYSKKLILTRPSTLPRSSSAPARI